MQGAGFYNRNSNLQSAGIELALPFFEAAALSVPAPGNGPVVISDYGSSQGRNSMRPMRLAIDNFRRRFGSGRPIEVIHTDLPSNDFTSLFTALGDDATSYLTSQRHVFASAIGRSYFEPILAPNRVHLAWNSWTLHWMSRNPVEVPDHMMAVFSTLPSAREAVRHQQAEDWRRFLAARSREMAEGAKLVSLSIGCTLEIHGWEWIAGELWKAAIEMADEGRISDIELLRFTLPVAGRSVADLEAPFSSGEFDGLTLEHAEVLEAPDPFWDFYRENGDARQLAKSWAGMMKAVSGPVAVAAFASRPDGGGLADELFERLEARVAAAPRRSQHFVAVAVVSKSGRNQITQPGAVGPMPV